VYHGATSCLIPPLRAAPDDVQALACGTPVVTSMSGLCSGSTKRQLVLAGVSSPQSAHALRGGDLQLPFAPPPSDYTERSLPDLSSIPDLGGAPTRWPYRTSAKAGGSQWLRSPGVNASPHPKVPRRRGLRRRGPEQPLRMLRRIIPKHSPFLRACGGIFAEIWLRGPRSVSAQVGQRLKASPMQKGFANEGLLGMVECGVIDGRSAAT
jgi:hypothetical protein